MDIYKPLHKARYIKVGEVVSLSFSPDVPFEGETTPNAQREAHVYNKISINKFLHYTLI
jgi:hypothetical protein